MRILPADFAAVVLPARGNKVTHGRNWDRMGKGDASGCRWPVDRHFGYGHAATDKLTIIVSGRMRRRPCSAGGLGDLRMLADFGTTRARNSIR